MLLGAFQGLLSGSYPVRPAPNDPEISLSSPATSAADKSSLLPLSSKGDDPFAFLRNLQCPDRSPSSSLASGREEN